MPSNMYFKPRKTFLITTSSNCKFCTALFIVVLFSIPVFFLLHSSSSSLCFPSFSNIVSKQWTGDLRSATFSWNRLSFANQGSRPLKIAVFSKKWPSGSVPGGMERHAYTLYMALAQRGHRVHVFTSPYGEAQQVKSSSQSSSKGLLTIHCYEGESGEWMYNKAWDQFTEENKCEAFDVIHSESVALPHWLARHVPNLVVTWHGIALEGLQSIIYQDLARDPKEPMSLGFNKSIQGVVPKVLDEIRFFHNYAHHVAISDSCGAMLRDVYQIPTRRVHVIINGVNESDFRENDNLGQQFRSKIGVPNNATLVIGVAGRLVKDKGHPLVFVAFSRFIKRHPNVYLIAAGSGPWEKRYRRLGPQVLVLGAINSSELGAFYNAIDVFLNPTLRPQGLDLTLMEAMMSATPVMASRFPSIERTVVVEEEFGFLFAPNLDSLQETLEVVVKEGPQRLAQRGKSCKEYAESMFNAHNMALAYERLFLCVKNETFCKFP